MKRDIYTEATNRIIEQLEAGVAPWVKPWSNINCGDGFPYNAATGRNYSGCNIMFLGMAGMHYDRPAWLTFKQALDLGGNVRKGEHGTKVYLMRPMFKTENRDGQKVEKKIFLMREYTVFNVAQCDGLPERVMNPEARKPVNKGERIALIEEFVKATGANIRHGGNEAFWRPSSDHVQMPQFDVFKTPDHYYATLFHELGHWTGPKHRLDRDMGKRFGDDRYAAEELVAELTAAFLCAEWGMDGELRHADYLASWLKVLKADSRAIFTAASKAQAACDFLRGLAVAEDADEPDAKMAA